MLKAFYFPWGKERIHGAEMLSMLLQPGYHVLQSFVNESGTRRMGSNFLPTAKAFFHLFDLHIFVSTVGLYTLGHSNQILLIEKEWVSAAIGINCRGFSHNECGHFTKTLRPLHTHQPIHGIQRVWLKILDPRKMDDKNYQTRSQICGSKLVPNKIWGLPFGPLQICGSKMIQFFLRRFPS